MNKLTGRELRVIVLTGIATASTAPVNAFAAGMPWENPLRQLLGSLQGPTAQTIIIMAIVIAGLTFCVGEAGSFFRKCAAAVFGIILKVTLYQDLLSRKRAGA